VGSWPLEPFKHSVNPTRHGLQLASAMRLRASAKVWDLWYHRQMCLRAPQHLES
jgi:hypothetical protein